MAQMTGTCTYCGQTRLVDADSQRQADLVATENCACDNIMKKRRMIFENIEELCGQNAVNYGMEQLTEEALDTLKTGGELCLRGLADSISMKAAGSSISIRTTGKGVKVERKKVSSVGLEA